MNVESLRFSVSVDTGRVNSAQARPVAQEQDNVPGSLDGRVFGGASLETAGAGQSPKYNGHGY